MRLKGTLCVLFTLAIVIAAIPFFQIAGLFVAKYQAKQSFKSCLNHNLVDTLYLSSDDFSNLQSGDEIYVGDNKYDIISVQNTAGKLFVVAVNDTAEKAIETWLRGHSHDSNTPPLSSKTTDWISGFVFEYLYFDIGVDCFFSNCEFRLPNGDYRRVSQPPELG